MTGNSEIRHIFYDYFSKKKHRRVLSAPLIPAKDPSLLFTKNVCGFQENTMISMK
jgi:alanyl-tRNA synthetase